MPRKAIICLLEFRICLFLLHTGVYLTLTEIRVYKHSIVVSLYCLSYRNVTELHHTTVGRITKLSFTVYRKYTLADVTLFCPLKLGITTLILYKDDFECLSGHPV